MSYTPYGEKIKSASAGLDIFHQKYTGQVDDGEESGLMYYNARYYDPKLGRFISADTMIPDPSYSQSFNRYMYVNGNPINYSDPSGHFSFKKFVKNTTKALIGAQISYYAGGVIAVGAYIAGGTHNRPDKAKNWENFDNGRANANARVACELEVVAGLTIACLYSQRYDCIIAGLFNAYFTLRAGGSFNDICAAYSIAVLVSYYSPTAVAGSDRITYAGYGMASAGASNLTTQGYNMTIADNRQNSFNTMGFISALAVGGALGYLGSYGDLMDTRAEINSQIVFTNTTVGNCKLLGLTALYWEEMTFYNGPNSNENHKTLMQGIDNVNNTFNEMI